MLNTVYWLKYTWYCHEKWLCCLFLSETDLLGIFLLIYYWLWSIVWFSVHLAYPSSLPSSSSSSSFSSSPLTPLLASLMPHHSRLAGWVWHTVTGLSICRIQGNVLFPVMASHNISAVSAFERLWTLDILSHYTQQWHSSHVQMIDICSPLCILVVVISRPETLCILSFYDNCYLWWSSG